MSRWLPEPIEKRFDDRFVPEPNSGCWLWIGDANGSIGRYGSLVVRKIKDGTRWRKIRVLAHRLAWLLFRGPIPDGMEVAHTCDVTFCVNPWHLFLATHKQNMDDREQKGRTWRGEQMPQSKLTEDEVLAIRASAASIYLMAVVYDIAPQTVSEIRRRLIWKHI